MNRRQFVALSSVTALTACAGGITDDSVALQVVNDVEQIAAGLSGSIDGLSGLPIFGQVSQDVTLLQQLAHELAPGTSISSAKTTVQKIEDVVNNILTVAASVPLPPPFGPALQAAAFLLPIIESLVGLVISKPAAATMDARLRPTMTPDQARQILSNAAKGR